MKQGDKVMGECGNKGQEDKPLLPHPPITPPPETGGPAGLEPTRYGDWEINGKCVDF